MDAAFALVVAKHAAGRGRPWLPPAPTEEDLGLEATSRIDWTDASGRVQLAAWQQASGGAGDAWHEADGGVTVVAGSVRRRGGRGAAMDLARAASTSGIAELQDDLRGVFAALHVDASGDGWVITDVLGLRLLYWAEDEEVVVVASRAALAAQVIARSAVPPRDGASGAWLAFSGFRLGDGSGFADVRVASPGARFVVRRGSGHWDDPDPLVVAPDDELRSLSLARRVDLLEAEVGEALRAALEHPAQRHIVRLTGGKDSRLVLALALRAGVADEFVYETVGPPELADVQIAAELCDALGLRHEVRFLDMAHDEPFADRFHRFVDTTACMVNGWDLATYAPSPEVRITGLGGELLRRYRKIPDDRWTDDGVASMFPRHTFGRLGLVDGELATTLYDEHQARLAHHPGLEHDPLARVQVLFAGSRMRFTRMGAREELAGAHPLMPLYSPATVRAAMSMDSADRHGELLFAETMRRASDILVDHRFTDAGWDDRTLAHLGRAGRPPAVAAPAPVAKAPALFETLYAKADDRTEMLADLFAARDNAAWAHLDRAACLDALARYPSLRTPERYELFGAATVVRWLS